MFFRFDMSDQILMVFEALSTYWTDVVKVSIFMCFFMNDFGLKGFKFFGTFSTRVPFLTSACLLMK